MLLVFLMVLLFFVSQIPIGVLGIPFVVIRVYFLVICR